MHVKFLTSISAAAICLAAASTSSAATIIFTDESAFEDQIVTTEAGFEPTAGWQLTAWGTSSQVVEDRLEGTVRSNGETTMISMGTAVNAFGGFFDLSRGGWGHGLRFTLVRSNGAEEVLGQILSHRNGFFGISSSEAFDAIKISWSGSKFGSKETYALTDVKVSAASLAPVAISSPAPEPSSWALMLSGFMLVGGAMRRRGLTDALSTR